MCRIDIESRQNRCGQVDRLTLPNQGKGDGRVIIKVLQKRRRTVRPLQQCRVLREAPFVDHTF